MKKQFGFVLPIMLMLLMLFSLLAISATEISLLQIKSSNHMLQQDRSAQAAMSCLQQAETMLSKHEYSQAIATKIISDTDYHDQKWWQEKAEYLSQYEQFVIEKIDTVPCHRLPGEQSLGVDFYRVTARVIENSNNHFIVQSTFAKVADKSPACKNPQNIQVIQQGRQGWREIM